MTDDALPSRAGGLWGLTVALSTVVMVAFGVLFYSFSVFVTTEAAGAEFSVSVMSTAWTGTLLVGGLLALAVGRTADRRGMRGIMSAGVVLGALGLFAWSVATEPWQLVAASWLLIGPAGAMTYYQPAFIAVDQWIPVDQRPRALAALTVIGGLAGPLAIPIAGALVGAAGWRVTATAFGVVFLVVGLSLALLVFPSGAPKPRTPRAQRASISTIALFGDRRFALFTAAMLCAFAGFDGVIFHRIAAFEQGGFGVAAVAAWAGIAGLLSLPGRWVAPYLARRVSPIMLTAATSLVLAGSVAIAAVAARPWQMVAHFVVFGASFGAIIPLRAVVMSEWYSGPTYGRTIGAQWTIVGIGAAGGPLLVGLVRDRVGSYSASLWLVTVALVLAALLTFLAGRAVRRP